jgi:hypothetical protein
LEEVQGLTSPSAAYFHNELGDICSRSQTSGILKAR